MAQVDLNKLNGTELLALYNKFSITKRAAKFQNKDQAIARVKAAMEAARATETVAKPKTSGKVKAEEPVVEKNGKPAKAAKVGVKVKKEESVIRIMTEGGENPRRPGSDAHLYFEAMKGGISVADYMGKFPSDKDERKKAKQWLWNTKRDGHVELVG